MAHTHHHKAPDYNRAFAIGVSLNAVFVIIEAGYGIVTNSLALVADAGHNMSDVLSLKTGAGEGGEIRPALSDHPSGLQNFRYDRRPLFVLECLKDVNY